MALNTARQHIIDINSVYQQGLDWLRNDQACDTLGSDNIGEDIKVEITEVPGLDFDQFPSNCSEIKNNVVLIPRSDSGNLYDLFISPCCVNMEGKWEKYKMFVKGSYS